MTAPAASNVVNFITTSSIIVAIACRLQTKAPPKPLRSLAGPCRRKGRAYYQSTRQFTPPRCA